jgi:hypothetical protein
MLLSLLLGSAALPAMPALAQPSPAAPSISREQVTTAVRELERLIRQHYVTGAMREPIAARLRRGLDTGRYYVADPREVAQLITQDLRDVTSDGHLGVDWDPQGFARLQTPDNAAWTAARQRDARVSNHGLTETRMLDGNVRYLRISRFHWVPDETGAAYEAAMRFLRGGDAIIIDVRGNGGGSSSAVRYAISHFMPGVDEQLLMTFSDDERRPDQSRVLGYLPAGRIIGRPIFVLVDSSTNSAAEEFVYHFDQFRLGTLVGERTRGAANNNRFFPVSPGFTASISYFRPIHSVSGGNWDGAGITPHLASTGALALEAAHAAALEKLASSASGDARIGYEWLVPPARARLSPLQLSASELQRYEGTFGNRNLRLEGGKLVYRGPGRPPLALIPLTSNLFAFPDTDQIRVGFELENGRAKTLRLLLAEGGSRDFPRSD